MQQCCVQVGARPVEREVVASAETRDDVEHALSLPVVTAEPPAAVMTAASTYRAAAAVAGTKNFKCGTMSLANIQCRLSALHNSMTGFSVPLQPRSHSKAAERTHSKVWLLSDSLLSRR
jgi:hypothetical protein